ERLDAEEPVLDLADLDGRRIEFHVLQVGKPGPQPLWPVFRVIVETLAVLAAEPPALLDHLLEQRLLADVDWPGTQILFRRLQDLPGEVDRNLIVERERADRHAGHAADVIDHRGWHTVAEH